MKNIGTRRAIALVTTAVLSVSLASCSSSKKSAQSGGASSSVSTSAGKPLSIEAVIDQTGPLGPVYLPGAAGVRAYFDQLNKNGGVDGRQVDLKISDSQSTSAAAQGLYRQAIDDKPVAIFSMSASTGVSASAELLGSSGIPVLGVGIADSLLYPQPKPNIYMLQPTSKQQIIYGLGLVKRLRNNSLQGAKIAMVGLSPSSIIDIAYKDITAEVKQEGGQVVAVDRPTSPIVSFTTQAVSLAQSKPDAVFLSLAPSDAVTVAKAIKAAGLNVPVIVLPSSGTDAPSVFQAIGGTDYYAVRFVNLPSDTKEESSLAGSTYAGSAAWATGWLFGSLITAALKKCGPGCDAAKLNQALQTGGPYDLGDVLYGPVSTTSTNHAVLSAVQYYVWNPTQSRPEPSGGVIQVGSS